MNRIRNCVRDTFLICFVSENEKWHKNNGHLFACKQYGKSGSQKNRFTVKLSPSYYILIVKFPKISCNSINMLQISFSELFHWNTILLISTLNYVFLFIFIQLISQLCMRMRLHFKSSILKCLRMRRIVTVKWTTCWRIDTFDVKTYFLNVFRFFARNCEQRIKWMQLFAFQKQKFALYLFARTIYLCWFHLYTLFVCYADAYTHTHTVHHHRPLSIIRCSETARVCSCVYYA